MADWIREEVEELGAWNDGRDSYASCVFQIVFNEISAAEISQLETLDQLELMDEFKVGPDDLDHLDGDRFGKIERDGKVLFRFRAKDYRVYFEVKDNSVVVHRVLHKGTFSDWVFRSKIPLAEDEELAKSKHFWQLIDEGRAARRV
ncbi:hypothetical protein [Haloferula rosea]|uniref:hypothetical protein n=1 Tax=Haloferula rosea TaxID=490093 RepID=UPI001F2A386A|nr:hypothetical protein [Haloferula rosea]